MTSACVVLLALAVRISLNRAYAVDEFAYAHGGWLVSKGFVPTLDFFETKFHLPLWIFSTVFQAGGDDPHLIQSLRLLMWVFVGGVIVASCFLNRGFRPFSTPATVLVLVANPVFMNSALEIRPDIVALAFLLAALALLSTERRGRLTGFGVGVLLGLCLWGTAKAAIYASPLALAWIYDVTRRESHERLIFPMPRATLAGGLSVVLGVIIYLMTTGAFEAFFAQAIDHNRQFLVGERWRSWQVDLIFLGQGAAWFHVLVLVELGWLIARWRTNRDSVDASGVLLVLLLVSSLASHCLQLYPFLYSLIPFMAIEGILAGRGLARLLRHILVLPGEGQILRENEGVVWPVVQRCMAGAVALIVVFGVVGGGRIVTMLGAETNQSQHAVFNDVIRITDPSDVIYDNSGSYITRPNAYFMPWTDAPIRQLWAEKLATEVPAAIEEKNCVVAIVDDRFHTLPDSLKRYIGDNFKSYRGPILLWGKDFDAPGGRHSGAFVANRAGRYRVLPAEIATEGGLTIEGRPIISGVFMLTEGEHAVEYDGLRGGFRLQWYPAESRLALR